jgi:hypothetical protein
MLRPAMGDKSRGPPRWGVIVSWALEYRGTEIDPGVHPLEGEHPLEAMCHWHDPIVRVGTLRCGRKSLLDDNPSSG